MKVEFTGRFADRTPKTEEEKANDELQRILDPEYVPEKKTRYTYDPITLDLSDISAWIKLDREHTQLNTYDKDVYYIIKLPYLLFSEIYEDLSGEKISVIKITTTEYRPKVEPYSEVENLFVDEDEK